MCFHADLPRNVGIVPAPGVQILRLVNIESQFTGFENPARQAPLLRHPQVLREALGAKAEANCIRRRADQGVGPDVMPIGHDRHARMLQVGSTATRR